MQSEMASQKDEFKRPIPAGKFDESGLPDAQRTTTRLAIGTMPSDFEAPQGLIPVAAFKKKGVADEFGLAILAMGESYWAFFSEGRHILCTAPDSAERVAIELVEFSRLRRRKHLQRVDEPEFPFCWTSAVAYAMVLGGFFALQQQSGIWIEIGRADASAIIRQGEWWRCVTALFLHADSAHLGANIISGAGFALILSKLYGGAFAWALILLAGALGTALTAGVYYPGEHLSIGASTAVFAALGLLTATGMIMGLRAGKRGLGLPGWLIPLLAGLTLLGFLGVGESNDLLRRIDLVAHVSGFVIGILLGLPMALLRKRLFRRQRLYRWGGILFVFWIVFLAWATALGWI
jgi:rhomboid protease GluP